MQYSLKIGGQQSKHNNILNVDILKKNILNDAQSYNIHTANEQKQISELSRQKQRQHFSEYNKRLETELQTEHKKKMQYQNSIKNTLKEEYQAQMQIKQKERMMNKNNQKYFAEALEQYQNNYHNRRMNDIAKMYRINDYRGKSSQPRHQSHQYKTLQSQPFIQKKQQPNPYRSGKRVNYTITNNQHQSQSYKQYLQKQINRKKQLKEKFKTEQLETEKKQIYMHNNVYQDSLDELKQKQKKQQQQFKKALDEQVQIKYKKSGNSSHRIF